MMDRRPVLVIGAAGQVARALARSPLLGDRPLVCHGRPQCDITDPVALTAIFAAINPAVVVNAAAYTAVDQAENDRATAFATNAEGPKRLALLCRDYGVPLVHLSSDYVFDGIQRTPYRETDPVAPIGAYGASKAAGEAAIRNTYFRHIILRTAWVYSADGHNFLKSMLRLCAERPEIAIVDDQRGTPTWAQAIAQVIVDLIPQLLSKEVDSVWGTYHLTNSGETTWFGFASEIFRLIGKEGLPTPRLRAIASTEYPTTVKRPAYSVLDNNKIDKIFGIHLPEWQASLSTCIASLQHQVRE
jgi:dTDP-4-dehydrorhamnose reductase